MARSVQVVSAADAAGMVGDGVVLAVGGSGNGHGVAEAVLAAIEARFQADGHPRGLTLFQVVGIGDWRTRCGVERLAYPGLVRCTIGSNIGNSPILAQMAAEGAIEGYSLPQGVLSQLCRAMAGRQPGLATHVGLHTFVDPRLGGGRLNERSRQELVEVVRLAGQELLFYRAIPPDVALIRATTADEAGNLSLEEETAFLDALPLLEVAPGIDVERDVLAHMAFHPLEVDRARLMDAALRRHDAGGVGAYNGDQRSRGVPLCSRRLAPAAPRRSSDQPCLTALPQRRCRTDALLREQRGSPALHARPCPRVGAPRDYGKRGRARAPAHRPDPPLCGRSELDRDEDGEPRARADGDAGGSGADRGLPVHRRGGDVHRAELQPQRRRSNGVSNGRTGGTHRGAGLLWHRDRAVATGATTIRQSRVNLHRRTAMRMAHLPSRSTSTRGRTTRRLLLASGASVAAGSLAAACSGIGNQGNASGRAGTEVPAAKGEIRWMSRAASEAARQIQVPFGPAFEQHNPGAKVTVSWPPGNFQELLTAAIAGGDPPDMAFIAASQFQVLAAQSQVASLDDYMKRDASLKKDDIYPIWLKGLQFKGQQYAMPFDPSVLLLYYNRTIFDRLQIPHLDPAKPMTWEDVLDLARRLTLDQNGVDSTRGNFDASAVKQAGITVQPQYFWWFLPRQNGQEFYTPDLSAVTLNQPATRAAYQWLVDLHAKYRAAVPSPVVKPTSPISFPNGNLAMWVWGLWGVPDIRSAGLTDDWDVVPLPSFRGKQRIGLGWASGNVVIKSARNPDGAWQLAKFLTTAEAQSNMMSGGNVQPMRKSLATDAAYRDRVPPHSKDVPIKEADVATAPLFYPHNTELQPMILQALDGVYRGEESLDAMISRVTPLMNEKLREYRARFNY